jgi:superfamily I DNA and/or RNA helicase
VITPYAAQVERLRALPALAEVEVGTVNAFQGREKDAIVVSFVRSNDDLELGFVADARRLVVAVTRARRAFVGVGDSATLCGFGPLRALIDAAAPGLRSAFEIDTFDVDGV